VTVTYYLSDGAPRVARLNVPPRSRRTIVVHEAAQGVGRGKEVSATVTTTNPGGIVAERPMYFRYGGSIDGGHDVVGVTAPKARWLFAEGYTGAGFDQYFTILNPGGGAVQVTITYYLSDGGVRERTVAVGPTQRRTVAVHGDGAGIGRGAAAAAVVESTGGPVVVERPIYFRYGADITGGHTAAGYAP
jgi:hypothetical protein